MMKLDLTAGSARERVGSQAHPAQGTERSDTGRWRYPWLSRSEEHTSELQSLAYLVCRLLLANAPSTPEIYPLSLHDALPISDKSWVPQRRRSLGSTSIEREQHDEIGSHGWIGS